MSVTSTPRTHDAVVLYPARHQVPEHEAVIHRDIALRLADLLDIPFDGVYDEKKHMQRCYFVPTDTLLSPALKSRLGVRSEMDMFGGYADHPFMPTKAITHGLVGPHAYRPEGWTDTFSKEVEGATLPGHTAFSVEDLRTAAARLLDSQGVIRLKPVKATAGRGQKEIAGMQDLERALNELETDSLSQCGVVLEAHLSGVATYSVGQVRLPGLTASYVGTQRLTIDNDGHEVYGGSSLQFVRGGYDRLHGLPLTDECRCAVDMARRYDAAADRCYPGFFASRRNYDVAAGVDARGRRRVGVLEQSWRIGGASRAEVAALEVLAADPACERLRAATLELFGDRETAPLHAVETFSGVDPDLGLIRKYVMVEAYGNQQ